MNIHYTHFLKGFSCLRFNFKSVNIFGLFRKISLCACKHKPGTGPPCTRSQAWRCSPMGVRVGYGNSKGALHLLPHPPGLRGWHQGVGWLKFQSFPSPSTDRGIHTTCVLAPKACEWARPDSTAWHGVGSYPAGSATWPSPLIPSLPRGHEPLLSCLPRSGQWKGLLGSEGDRFQQPLPPPLLWGTATGMGQ